MKKLLKCLTLIFVMLAGSLTLLPALPSVAHSSNVLDINDTVVLHGNVHPLARPEFDIGAADPSMKMERMILTLRLSDDKQAELDRLLSELHDPASPNYHRWLTPEEFGSRFGPSDGELNVITDWLISSGLTIDKIAKGRLSINFSGSVAAVNPAFHTQIRNYYVNGVLHHANDRDPSIPRGLSNLVAGVVSLHDFRLKMMNTGGRPVDPEYTNGSAHYLAPGDFAIIYDVNALYNAGINGTGQSIAIVGRTNPSTAASDWALFRSTFGLPANPPQIIINGPNPGDLGANEDFEANLDVEWSGAVAQNASILFVTSKSTASTDGVNLSAQYIVENNLAPVMSTSFGECESDLGSTENTFFNTLWQQASAQGITSFVSSGDSGAADCNADTAEYGTQLAVNGLASTPYNVAVGGSQFNEGSGNYWNGTNGPGYVSVISYIPEIAWNQSGLEPGGSGLLASGGGASSIYPKPSWQSAPGVPASNSRYVPDVALSAATHDSYLVAQQGNFYGIGGTSASSPSFAGLMALVGQKTGQPQGNANVLLYQIGVSQYGQGGAVIFHDIISGNNSVPAPPPPANNVLTGYSCTPGYDPVTGLGTVDANALVNAMATSPPGAPTGVTAVAGNGQATMSFTPPASNGGSPVTYYTVTSSPGNITTTGASSPIIVTGLTNGTAYTFTVTASNAYWTGAASASSNSITPVGPPGAPTGVTAVAGNGQATVSFTPPASNGGGAISSYSATSSPGNISTSGPSSPIIVTGLTDGTVYTFTVTATNSTGMGPASSPSNSVTPVGPPGAPAGVTATAGIGQAIVSFNAPAFNGGSPILSYTATSNPGNISAGGAGSPIAVAGLSPGTSYSFTVTATNAVGTGPASAASNSVTPYASSYNLSVTVIGNGTVHSSPGNDIDCTGDCGQLYSSGTVLTLTATPSSGYGFAGWSGACTGSGSCMVTMNAAESVTATFQANAEGIPAVPAVGTWGLLALTIGLAAYLAWKRPIS